MAVDESAQFGSFASAAERELKRIILEHYSVRSSPDMFRISLVSFSVSSISKVVAVKKSAFFAFFRRFLMTGYRLILINHPWLEPSTS